jgi:hypothetical protein
VAKHPFDNIPGPPSPSFFTGGRQNWPLHFFSEPATRLYAGNYGQLLDPRGWEFHKHLVDTFGGTVRIQGLLGVGSGGVWGCSH